MSTSTVAACSFCALPVHCAPPPRGEVFCCHACRMVAGIVGGRPEAPRSWELLRLSVGTLLAMNVMMLSLLLYAGSVEPHTVPALRLVLLGLSAPALAILLPPFLRGAAGEAAGGAFRLDALICLGSLAAFTVSASRTVAGSGEVYFDTATMIPVLVTAGRFLESTAKGRAATLLRALEALLPANALRVRGGSSQEVPVAELEVGDLVRVRPGERFAVDGRVEEGCSVVEEAPFTGEFLPRLCREGERVSAGMVNGAGTVLVRAERVSGELLLERIVHMVQEAWQAPPASCRVAERAAALFIPLVVVLALASLLFWTLSGDAVQGGVSALAVLVVACPCTMGIAAPLVSSLAVARAAREGVVVRGGDVLERVGEGDLVFFDKTGTLTQGRPALKRIVLYDREVGEDELLGRLAALEGASEHVLGKAVLEVAAARGVAAGSAREVRVYPGCGITGVVDWGGSAKRVTAGSLSFVRERSGGVYHDEDGTTIEVAWDGAVRGRLTFHDPLRESAAPAIELLREKGVRAVLLSGDNAAAVAEVAGLLALDGVAARTPEQKAAEVEGAVASGKRALMVGDGINDAAALAAAYEGIALGAGTELARISARIVILSNDLRLVPWLVALSRRARTIMRVNFAWAFAYNAVALAAAAAGMLHPLLAALAMVFSSLTVLANSLRIATFPQHPERS